MPIEPLRKYMSIEAPSKLYETNTRPILISVSDNEYSSYVVKHNNGRIPCEKLAYELIAYFFLKIWNLNTPKASIIQVDSSHVQNISSNRYQPRFFRTPCWGTIFHSESTEFLQFFEQLPYYEREKFNASIDLLRIVLFDLWVSNDDRTANNPNILVVSTTRGFEFWPIDHEAIFNGNNLDQGLYELSLHDTLLYHPALKNLLGRTLKDSQVLEELIEDAYVCINLCQENITQILSLLPKEWGINNINLEQSLQLNLFSDDWVFKLRNTFLTLIQELP